MKKIGIILLSISMVLMLALTPKAHAYTLSSEANVYYNTVTSSIGNADVVDIGSTYIEYMYFNLGSNSVGSDTTIRAVFSNIITSELLPPVVITYNFVKIDIYLINSLGHPLYTNTTYFDAQYSFSYFETNFITNVTYNDIDAIYVKVSNLQNGYDEDNMHKIMHGLIIANGSSMIINQTISTTQYSNGWKDAMNSKVTQMWSLWGNIFDTFMSVFDVFSVKLMGDITIGHLAMVPLVLGLIGFIYALGGKRGR